jgi:hypothetical protein
LEDTGPNTFSFTTHGSPQQSIDTPTNNLPTLDPLVVNANATISKAMTRLTGTSGWCCHPVTAEIPITPGYKYGFEIEVDTAVPSGICIGIGPFSADTAQGIGFASGQGVGYRSDGIVFKEGATLGTYATYTAGDKVQLEYRSDINMVNVYKNEVFCRTVALSTISADGRGLHFFASCYDTCIVDINMDMSATGLDCVTMSAQNMPEGELPILEGERGLWVHGYVGNGATKVITGSPFGVAGSHIMIWLKCLGLTHHHKCIDTLRGVNTTKNELRPNTNDAAFNNTTGVTAFGADGYTLGANLTYNDTGEDFINFVFNMLPKYGMDIQEYTGSGVSGLTITHDLGAPPELIIIKSLTTNTSWMVGHKDMDAANPWAYYMSLDSDIAKVSGGFGAYTPAATYFQVGSNASLNTLSTLYIAYLFRSIPGFLKVGYYIGNGSTNGTRVYTGFRPRFILVKHTGGSANWTVFDSERSPYNAIERSLYANQNYAELDGTFSVDFLSNGFKWRASNSTVNSSGYRFIYLAIGSAPFPFCNAY